MGTITGISDLDPARWPNSHWRSVKVFMVQEHSFACCDPLHYVVLENLDYVVRFELYINASTRSTHAGWLG